MIALTYGANTALYWDGALLTNGPALTYWPGPTVLSNGFFIGSDSTGGSQARGMFDDLAAYDVQLDADTVFSLWYSGWIFYMNPMNKANNIASAHSEPAWTPSFNAITGSGYLISLSTNLSGCVSSTNVWITNVVVTAVSNGTMNLSFSI